jgi:eukaryotic-like serine/threonine-protein kinase
MTLAAGTRLGPYEILSPLGAGGMGEVYRARDTRLGREVAVKVLPAGLSQDPDRLARFEQEARAASALNHPNIVSVYDVGRSESGSFLAMELVEGKTVRELVAAGSLPIKRALSIAAQTADGLAKAHAAGIVHRDLKPENLMVSADGFLKILDFGLAKLVEEKTAGASGALTAAAQTASGIVLGTVGYMSPEQAGGASVDFRSDQFALGAILYEMVTGRRAFAKTTAVDTLSAILHEEPEPIAGLRPETPTGLRWLLDRCLAKEPDERYASTRDLARDLAMLRDRLSEAGPSGPAPVRRRPPHVLSRLAVAVPLATLLVLAGLLAGRSLERRPAPSYRQLTFRQGTVRSARFSPDGQTAVYAASWGGQPLELFSVRPGTPESRSLGALGANNLAVSSKGEMALVLRNRYLGLFPGFGTLARMPLEGGAAPRDVLEDVSWADWSPDGSAFAVVRQVGSRQRLEYPVGTVLYETAGWISHPRVAPDGRRVAILDHPSIGDDRGSVALVDRAGRKTLGGRWSTAWGLAWRPDGKEVWFTAAKSGARRALRAVSPSGRERQVVVSPTGLTLHDIARDGRVLIGHDEIRFGSLVLPPGEERERDLTWLDLGAVTDISPDGRTVVLSESGEGGEYSIYLRKTDGSPAVRLGHGWLGRLSPDEKWVLTTDVSSDPPQLVLLPTGPGEPVVLTKDKLSHAGGRFLPDGKRIVFAASEPEQTRRLYILPVAGGEARPISSAEVLQSGPISPDGLWVAARNSENRVVLFPTSSGDPVAVPGIHPPERAVQWSPDGKFLYIYGRGELPMKVSRVEVASGKRELWREFAPSDPAGVVEIQVIELTPDASAFAYTYVRILSELYVAEGLR